MKFNKVAVSLTAAAVAASAMTAAASASIKVVDGNEPPFLTSGSGMWMVMLYKGDGPSVEIDYGLDLTSIAQMKVQFTTDDPDFFEGMFGGALVMSCGPASATPADHNWVQKDWWGVVDDDAELWTQNAESPVVSKKIGDYTYEVSVAVDDSNCFYDNATYCQAAIMEWGQDLSQLVVLGMQFYDASGNSMIEFDANGNANIPNIAGQAADDASDDDAAADDTAADDDAAADETEAAPAETEAAPAEAEAAPAETEAAPAQTEAAPAQTEAAPAQTEAAPAQTEAVTTAAQNSAAPAAGNVAAATNSTKGSPDTGVADVAAVAGLAIVAAGAVLVAKKRK